MTDHQVNINKVIIDCDDYQGKKKKVELVFRKLIHLTTRAIPPYTKPPTCLLHLKCTSDFFPQFYVPTYVIAIQALCFSKFLSLRVS